MNKASTNSDLNSQHPSWNIAAASPLDRIKQNTRRWKTAKVKLILIIADVPMQVDRSPEAAGH